MANLDNRSLTLTVSGKYYLTDASFVDGVIHFTKVVLGNGSSNANKTVAELEKVTDVENPMLIFSGSPAMSVKRIPGSNKVTITCQLDSSMTIATSFYEREIGIYGYIEQGGQKIPNEEGILLFYRCVGDNADYIVGKNTGEVWDIKFNFVVLVESSREVYPILSGNWITEEDLDAHINSYAPHNNFILEGKKVSLSDVKNVNVNWTGATARTKNSLDWIPIEDFLSKNTRSVLEDFRSGLSRRALVLENWDGKTEEEKTADPNYYYKKKYDITPNVIGGFRKDLKEVERYLRQGCLGGFSSIVEVKTLSSGDIIYKFVVPDYNVKMFREMLNKNIIITGETLYFYTIKTDGTTLNFGGTLNQIDFTTNTMQLYFLIESTYKSVIANIELPENVFISLLPFYLLQNNNSNNAITSAGSLYPLDRVIDYKPAYEGSSHWHHIVPNSAAGSNIHLFGKQKVGLIGEIKQSNGNFEIKRETTSDFIDLLLFEENSVNSGTSGKTYSFYGTENKDQYVSKQTTPADYSFLGNNGLVFNSDNVFNPIIANKALYNSEILNTNNLIYKILNNNNSTVQTHLYSENPASAVLNGTLYAEDCQCTYEVTYQKPVPNIYAYWSFDETDDDTAFASKSSVTGVPIIKITPQTRSTSYLGTDFGQCIGKQSTYYEFDKCPLPDGKSCLNFKKSSGPSDSDTNRSPYNEVMVFSDGTNTIEVPVFKIQLADIGNNDDFIVATDLSYSITVGDVLPSDLTITTKEIGVQYSSFDTAQLQLLLNLYKDSTTQLYTVNSWLCSKDDTIFSSYPFSSYSSSSTTTIPAGYTYVGRKYYIQLKDIYVDELRVLNKWVNSIYPGGFSWIVGATIDSFSDIYCYYQFKSTDPKNIATTPIVSEHNATGAPNISLSGANVSLTEHLISSPINTSFEYCLNYKQESSTNYQNYTFSQSIFPQGKFTFNFLCNSKLTGVLPLENYSNCIYAEVDEFKNTSGTSIFVPVIAIFGGNNDKGYSPTRYVYLTYSRDYTDKLPEVGGTVTTAFSPNIIRGYNSSSGLSDPFALYYLLSKNENGFLNESDGYTFWTHIRIGGINSYANYDLSTYNVIGITVYSGYTYVGRKYISMGNCDQLLVRNGWSNPNLSPIVEDALGTTPFQITKEVTEETTVSTQLVKIGFEKNIVTIKVPQTLVDKSTTNKTNELTTISYTGDITSALTTENNYKGINLNCIFYGKVPNFLVNDIEVPLTAGTAKTETFTVLPSINCYLSKHVFNGNNTYDGLIETGVNELFSDTTGVKTIEFFAIRGAENSYAHRLVNVPTKPGILKTMAYAKTIKQGLTLNNSTGTTLTFTLDSSLSGVTDGTIKAAYIKEDTAATDLSTKYSVLNLENDKIKIVDASTSSIFTDTKADIDNVFSLNQAITDGGTFNYSSIVGKQFNLDATNITLRPLVAVEIPASQNSASFRNLKIVEEKPASLMADPSNDDDLTFSETRTYNYTTPINVFAIEPILYLDKSMLNYTLGRDPLRITAVITHSDNTTETFTNLFEPLNVSDVIKIAITVAIDFANKNSSLSFFAIAIIHEEQGNNPQEVLNIITFKPLMFEIEEAPKEFYALILGNNEYKRFTTFRYRCFPLNFIRETFDCNGSITTFDLTYNAITGINLIQDKEGNAKNLFRNFRVYSLDESGNLIKEYSTADYTKQDKIITLNSAPPANVYLAVQYFYVPDDATIISKTNINPDDIMTKNNIVGFGSSNLDFSDNNTDFVLIVPSIAVRLFRQQVLTKEIRKIVRGEVITFVDYPEDLTISNVNCYLDNDKITDFEVLTDKSLIKITIPSGYVGTELIVKYDYTKKGLLPNIINYGLFIE